MGGARLRYSVACLILMGMRHAFLWECIHMFYEETTHALENDTTSPSPSIHMFYEETIHAHAQENQTTVLRVGVVQKRYFRELVSAGKNGTNPTGFWVEVFKKAIEPLNWTVEYITYGNGVDPPPSYDELIQLIADKEIDAVVGDITITVNRSQKVEFTQPFLDSSLVAVVRLKDESFMRSALVFMKPFTTQLWLLIAAFFVCGAWRFIFWSAERIHPFEGSLLAADLEKY